MLPSRKELLDNSFHKEGMRDNCTNYSEGIADGQISMAFSYHGLFPSSPTYWEA
jgi:hypothetical protein